MAWGLEARVPFLDKSFLEVAMNIDPQEKMFSKGSSQEQDADGRPKMEKVRSFCPEEFVVINLNLP
jgi:asparagine synthase (glutamine-hydrolysing)